MTSIGIVTITLNTVDLSMVVSKFFSQKPSEFTYSESGPSSCLSVQSLLLLLPIFKTDVATWYMENIDISKPRNPIDKQRGGENNDKNKYNL